MKEKILLKPAEAIQELKEYKDSKYCPEHLDKPIETAIENLSQGRTAIGTWEDIVEKDVPVYDRPHLTSYRTSQTCSVCKTRITLIGAKRYLKDNYCPNCGAPMSN